MPRENDVKTIIAQEQGLVFPRFDEAVAFSLGMRIRDRALREGLGLVADIRTWDRPLFYFAMPGTTGDNQHWVRRKYNLVQRVSKSSYRVVLENTSGVDHFLPRRGLDNETYVLAGGGFPIRVEGAGMIGCVTISGLHERDDHGVAVEALCEELGRDKEAFALSKAQAG
jgi:uncharacterized protein (UPF0303 family)